jgi:stage IV sporulation protein FB
VKRSRFSVSPLVVLYAAYFAFSMRLSEGAAYFVALILHELSHAYAAEKRGYALDRIKIGVFGASLCGKFETLKPADEIAIALAGPFFNLFSAAFFTALFWVYPVFFVYFENFVYASVALCLFNLLPVYPLDGGRVLIALLSLRLTRAKAYRIVRISGVVIAVVLGVGAILTLPLGFNPTLVTGSVFALSSTIVEDEKSKYESLFRLSFRSERMDKGLTVREIAVKPDFPITKAVRLLDSSHYTAFVLTDGALNPVAVLPETAFELPERSTVTSVSELYAAYMAKKTQKVKN